MRDRLLYILFVFVTLLVFHGCGNDEQQGRGGPGGFGDRGGQATSVEVVEIMTGSISNQIRSFGTIRPQDVVRITPQVSHRITGIHVDLGDSVEAGQVLATIYDAPFRDEMEQAQAQLRQARSAFQRDSTQFVRQRQLYESASISRSEFEEARATFESSQAQYESASAALTQSRENLDHTEVRSPVHGVILSRSSAVGDVASSGETIFEIANLAGYETRLWLPMHDWDAVQTGMPVQLRHSGSSGVIAEGAVSRISPQLNPDSGLGEVVVSLTSTGPGIRQGALVEARITLLTHENTVVISRSAMMEQVETYIEPETNTVELRQNYLVFVAKGDSVAEQRDITLGLEQGERVEVTEGLEPGERLIITGHRGLSDGANIRVAGAETEHGGEAIFNEESGAGDLGTPRGGERRRQQDGGS